jgi:hypothetical protein
MRITDDHSNIGHNNIQLCFEAEVCDLWILVWGEFCYG